VNANATIGWIVDCQEDFMDPAGRLYVHDLADPRDPGAVRIVPSLEKAVGWMRDHAHVVVYTGDWHGYDDEEIDAEAPDPTRGTYPPHCMGRASDPEERRGAEIIAPIRPADPLILDLDASEEDALRVARTALARHRPVFIHKNRFDVFEGNPATEAFLRALADEVVRAPTIVVAGVARDVCVTGAIDGMQARGYDVVALSDATWGLGLEDEETTLGRWRRKGRVITTAELP